ncbi:Large polyvalent protein associated domain-containing protein [Vibrio crassostreae]|nr:Large polyvalent protein associated domain-containing protein [Vibrio crassostreae]CAK2123084.1 Large polyvalent protein associated domain-containing protein [Vibrio crassostreae]CAK2257652.1 Large polyvalent protein associated domain-containing protein [Vibrio crassostreae]CAK2978736.1 Large polyvalent protein associated domain-containing protein [Vibrio crassostreae]CAK3442405.1 Large polyvalent protein associated domain-containing protein [Vibrio crassostreae]
MILKQQGAKAMLVNPSQTHTNVQIATNVSTLGSQATAQNDPSKSKEKQDFLTSFKAGKLRKNAKAKITKLLELADSLILKTQSMGMDDCFRSNQPVTMDKAEFWDWYEKNYSDMVILLTVHDGVLVKATVCDCIYHFSNDVVMTFSLDSRGEDTAIFENDPLDAEESEEVKEPVLLTSFDKYEHLKKTAVVKQVVIDWSEANLFSDGDAYTLDDYNTKATQEAREVGRNKGYSKTMMYIEFENGDLERFRHDIDADYPTLNHYYAAVSDIKLIALSKVRFTFEQVTKALIDGYLSPLNRDEKKPTPPTQDNTRKVVALGDYQERQETKRERLEDRAAKAESVSNERFNTASTLGKMLPFGQPILVGHHSEAKHRRHAESINTNMRKSVEAQDKAEYLSRRADSVGSAGIASDDPEAVGKLKEKLEARVKSQELMKAVNKVVRAPHMSEEDKIEFLVKTHGQTEEKAKNLLKPDAWGGLGFACYALKNNNAMIRTINKRLVELVSLHNEEPLQGSGESMGTAWELYEEEGRIKFSFEGIPDEVIRQKLKSNGFKWSRYSKAWVRKLTPNAVSVTKRLITLLN